MQRCDALQGAFAGEKASKLPERVWAETRQISLLRSLYVLSSNPLGDYRTRRIWIS